MKKNNKKGFTLAELLIVVAIIGVLTAIAIPVFTTQLEKSKLATATANVRSVYAQYMADCLAADPVETPNTASLGASIAKLTANQTQSCTITSTSDAITISNGAGSNVIKLGTGN